ncbi:threonine/serine exporter family protein [Eubacteriaceae bacterium ES3]|nr:threonine/serine exporter family protein [Eubacteriaceae bacterium ES3]
MTLSEISHIAIEMGTLLLSSGAETYRVEESISRVCLSLGAKEAEIFVIPTTIIIYIRKDGGRTITRTRRIHKRSIDLTIVDEINDLSRRLSRETLDYGEIIAEIEAIRLIPEYPFCLQVISTGFAALMFALFFGGSIKNSLIAFCIGVLINLQTHYMAKFETNRFFITIIAGMMISTLSVTVTLLGIAESFNTIIIGSIMPLVPGLAITQSLRDVIAGDYLAGITKGIEALLIGAAIATGVALPLSLFQSVLGVI